MVSAWECFHSAILDLVRSTPIKQRLVCAYRRHLSLLTEDQLPGDVRESFGQIVRAMTCVQPQRGEDSVAASVRKMSNQEAEECAAQVVEIFGVMSKTHVAAIRHHPIVQLHSIDRRSDEFEKPALIANI